jgi:methylaspartate ammonia-lyase
MAEQLKRFSLEIYNPVDQTLIRTEQYKNLKEISTKYNILYHTVRNILDEQYKNKRNVQAYTTEIVKVYKIKTNPII